MAEVKLVDVCKVYKGNVKAVKDFNLEIHDGEFLVFVGPSGCGKSTTLRMIAGLEEITSGKITIDQRVINDLEPKDRDIAMVFQNYALYPHMSVYENLAYSLNCHREDKKVIQKKVHEVAKMLDIEEYLLRKPKELSGGQRQRVALGRCLIRSPKVFLFDEPLSNLDAKLRVSMRSEISKLHQRIHGTFIYVTHDQTEAMTMGDRIVVMKDGVIQQVDTPVNLYEHPANVFVATFLGSPQMNIFCAQLRNDSVYLSDELSIMLSERTLNKMSKDDCYQEIYLGIRPGDFMLGSKEDHDIHIKNIELVEKLGNETLIYFMMPGKKELTLASLKLNITDDIDDEIYLKIDKEKLHLFDVNEESMLKSNEMNTIKAHIQPMNEDAVINGRYVFRQYSKKCINKAYQCEFEGLLKIASKDLVLNKTTDEDVELEVRVKAVDVYSDKKVIYSCLKEDEGVKITFYDDRKSKIQINDCVTVYAKMNKIQICDANAHPVTVDDAIIHPVREIELSKIGKEYYIKDKSKEFCKNKYFIIEKMFACEDKMILNVKNEKKEKYSLMIEKNTDLFAGMIIYTKLLK